MSEIWYNELIEDQIIDKINELYITSRKKYLVLNKNGEYSTISNGKLHDNLLKQHLQGNKTIGIFSGDMVSKFICFDIDMDKNLSDKEKQLKLKLVYYSLVNSLTNMGIDNNYIHVSSSGNKGLHILLFIKDGTSLKYFKQLFIEIMKSIQEQISDDIKTKLFNDNELVLEIKDICNIEFRPNGLSQGVKLELGINFKNNNNKLNKCWFVDKDTLELIEDNEYMLDIVPMPKDEFIEIIDKLNEYEVIKENINIIKSELKEPHSHKINKDENETIEFIVDLINNGLTMSGTRHNSILKIAKYFRYMGLELDDCITELKIWMTRQNKKYYSSTLEEALSECERISKIVYEKEYSLVGHIENIKIYMNEMKEIIKIKNKNDKILIYTMLLHSKRYALKNGVFYMTYKQMREMCGIGRKGAIASIKRLENEGILEVVSRDVRQDNDYKHKPNKYRINLILELDEVILEIDNTSNNLGYNELYYKSIINNFTNDELKHLPTRQYNEFTQLRSRLIS